MAKILVADDDRVMLGLLKTLMELEGNDVVTVTRPEDIVPKVKEYQPALILMDYNLAGGNSMDALRELKTDPDLKEIPILVASGMDREYECKRNGAEAFILKPFRPAELLERMRALMTSLQ
ncbi:MAG TPA: response regulator [Anaerolineae bacterium]|nr:response regulator [Anaerolineae bacterium]HQK12781.1 response regulator [Anaerolineae bacterium]